MLPFFNKNLIGVDIGAHSLKIVKLKGGRGPYTLESAVSVRVKSGPAEDAGDAQVSGLIAEVVRTKHLKSGMAASTVPLHSIILRHLYLPSMPERDMKEAVKWEIRKEISFPPNELISDYVTAGSSAKAAESLVSIIAFGSRRSDIEKLIAVFKNAGLELRVADALPMALLSVFDMNNDWEGAVNYAMLDIGEARSALTIFKDRKLCFAREISYGGADLTAAIAEAVNKGADEAEQLKIENGLSGPDEELKKAAISSLEGLCAELQRSFDYYQAQFREGAVSKLFLSGGTAMLSGIDEFITKTIGIAAFKHDPFRKVKIPSRLDNAALRAAAPCMNVAAGLAARCVNK